MKTFIRFSPITVFVFMVLAMFPNVNGSSGECVNVTVEENIAKIFVYEGTQEGHCWEIHPYDENLYIKPKGHNLLRTDNGSVILNRNLTLDGKENQGLCDFIKGTNTYEMTLEGNKAVLFFQVTATDDFPRQFNETSYEVHIREHNDENQTVIHFTSQFLEDGDCPIREASYNFYIKDSEDSSSFDISKNLIVVKTVLDYERQNKYALTIGLKPQNETATTANLTVFVDDVDDENPFFGSQTYSLNVTEAANLTNVWLSTEPNLWATDGDKGINETIEYSVFESDIDVEVNPSTGEVQIKTELDREKTQEHRVIIKASQKNDALRSATATLTINVLDVNDNLPKFSPTPHTPIQVVEGTPNGVLIIALPASDKDEGENGLFTYELEDESGAFDIKMDAATKTEWLVVKNSTALIGTEILTVKVMLKPNVDKLVDNQTCDFNTTCATTLQIQIVDVNNHDPVFEKATYIFPVQKDNLTIGAISASDKDKGDNGKVTYNLEPPDPSECQTLQIDPISGVLTTSKPFPNGQSCSFKVQACDNPLESKDRRCSSVPVFIQVNYLLKLNYNVSVSEGTPIGSVICQLPEPQLTVKDGNFSLESGSLKTKAEIDRETVPFYEVALFSLLDDSKQLSVVYINVLDVNDNAPLFKEAIFRTNVAQNMNPGDKLIQVAATDADAESNAILTYSLLNERDWFSIDKTTGVISILKQPLFGDMEKINLHVRVTDGGVPPLSSTAAVEVYDSLFSITASLILPLSVSRVEEKKDDITRFLSETLKYEVTIEKVEPLHSGFSNWSKLLISAKRKNGKSITRPTLENMLKSYASKIEEHYQKPTSEKKISDEDEEKYLIPFIVAVSIAGLILLILLVSLLVCSRRLKRWRQTASILKKLNADKTIYDSAGKQDNLQSRSINGSSNSPIEGGDEDTSSPNGFANPGFTPDEDGVSREREGDVSIIYDNVREDTALNQHEGDNGNEGEPSSSVYDNVGENTSLNQHEFSNETNGNNPDVPSGNADDISPSPITAVIDIPENDGEIRDGPDTISDSVQSQPTALYPDLPSLEREEEDESGAGSGTESLLSRDMPIDLGKSSDVDSGVPSDKDGADEDDDANSLEDSENVSGVGAKAKRDFDKPARKDITVGFADLDGSMKNDPTAIADSQNHDEPEPDYGKKVRFEQSHAENDAGTTTEERTDDKIDYEDPNTKYSLETEITAL